MRFKEAMIAWTPDSPDITDGGSASGKPFSARIRQAMKIANTTEHRKRWPPGRGAVGCGEQGRAFGRAASAVVQTLRPCRCGRRRPGSAAHTGAPARRAWLLGGEAADVRRGLRVIAVGLRYDVAPPCGMDGIELARAAERYPSTAVMPPLGVAEPPDAMLWPPGERPLTKARALRAAIDSHAAGQATVPFQC